MSAKDRLYIAVLVVTLLVVAAIAAFSPGGEWDLDICTAPSGEEPQP